MFLVGLTGGIATGKSTVAKLLKQMGCVVLDADKLAREVVEPGKPALKKIIQYFGSDIISSDGCLNREKLGEIVFTDEKKRRYLESVIHPEIYKAMLYQMVYHMVSGKQFVILDLPLLYEKGSMLRYLSEVIVVTCESDLQLSRLMSRNNLSEEAAMSRINLQMSNAEKCRRATIIIDNNGSLENTERQVREIHRALNSSYKHWKVRLVLGGVICILGYATYKTLSVVTSSLL